MERILDAYLEAAFCSLDAMDKRLPKHELDIIDDILRNKERALLDVLALDLSNDADSDKFDCFLDLVEAYRNDESQYDALVNYVESLR